MAPTPKHIQNKLMDLLAINGQVDRDIEAAERAIKNATEQLGNAKQRSERVKSLAVEIRDSKFVKDNE